MPEVRSQTSTLRSELYAVFGNRPRLIKAFENLLSDVAITLPENIDEATQEAAEAAQLAANQALTTAQSVLARVDALDDGPPALLAPPSASGDDPGLLFQLLERVAKLERDFANLKDGPTP